MNPSRQDAAQFVRDNFERIIQQAIINSQNMLLELDPETVVQKMLRAEGKYGPFNLKEIDPFKEITEEATDIANYTAFGLMQLDDRFLDEAYA